MATLTKVATRLQDLYFQDYPDRKEFIDMSDFKFHCAAVYSNMLDQMYQVFRKSNKQETGFANVELSAQWLYHEVIDKLQQDELSGRYYIETTFPIFGFMYDAFGNGLNGIRPYGNNKCNLKKISNQEIRFEDIIPTTSDIYYYLEGNNRIDFLKKPPMPLSPYYIPLVSAEYEDCVLSDNIVEDVIKEAYKIMLSARNGVVIPEADDGNRNIVQGQQVNPELTKAQKV